MAAALVVPASVAGAAGNPLWVSPGGHSGASDRGCAGAAYATISAALAAAPSGAVVDVCSGTYAEQLTVTQPVTIRSAPGATVTVQLPATPADGTTGCEADPNGDVSIVDICSSGAVYLNGLTIQGTWPADACSATLYGVLALGGVDLSIKNSTVESIGGNPLTDTCDGGTGIDAGASSPPGVASLSLRGVTVTGYQKTGVLVEGSGSTLDAFNTTVTGAGPSPALAQNGIQVSAGAEATIKKSTVSANACTATACGPDALTQSQAAGILFDQPGPANEVLSSQLTGNDIGLYNEEASLPATPAVLAKNDTVTGGDESVVLDQGLAEVTRDTLTGAAVGIEVLQYHAQSASAAGTATADDITSMSTAAAQVASDGSGGDPSVSFSIERSRLDPGGPSGVLNASTSLVDATKDWWGATDGPSSWSFGTGSAVSAGVTFFPWQTADGSGLARCTGTTNLKSGIVTSGANDAVLCIHKGATAGQMAFTGSGSGLLLGGSATATLNGSATGTTYIVGSTGASTIDGNGGAGKIQGRGGTDTCANATGYTISTC